MHPFNPNEMFEKSFLYMNTFDQGNQSLAKKPKKRWTRKRKWTVGVTSVTFVAVLGIVIGIFVLNTAPTSSVATPMIEEVAEIPSLTVNADNIVEETPLATQEMNVGELIVGDFTSIQGHWQNEKGQGFIISGDIFTMAGTSWRLTVVKHHIQANTLQLSAQPLAPRADSETAFGAAISLFPAGTMAHAGMPNFEDLTNQSRDRIWIGQSPASSEITAQDTFYRIVRNIP